MGEDGGGGVCVGVDFCGRVEWVGVFDGWGGV